MEGSCAHVNKVRSRRRTRGSAIQLEYTISVEVDTIKLAT
jgi:hypothetical protein